MGTTVDIGMSIGQLESLFDYLDLAQDHDVAMTDPQRNVKKLLEEVYNQEVVSGGL